MSHNYTTKDIARFNKKINKDAPNGCWEWKACYTTQGYGQFLAHGKPTSAHRVSYEMNVGKIPDGLHVCHTCDNPKCVNPNHQKLRLDTPRFIGERKNVRRSLNSVCFTSECMLYLKT